MHSTLVLSLLYRSYRQNGRCYDIIIVLCTLENLATKNRKKFEKPMTFN